MVVESQCNDFVGIGFVNVHREIEKLLRKLGMSNGSVVDKGVVRGVCEIWHGERPCVVGEEIGFTSGEKLGGERNCHEWEASKSVGSTAETVVRLNGERAFAFGAAVWMFNR